MSAFPTVLDAPSRTRAPWMPALALVTGTAPLATDMYLAAFPAMQRSLDTTPAGIQLTLTAFIVGFAVGQLGAGPLSDGIGRRPFIVAGSSLFACASFAIVTAPPIKLVIALRLLQGLGGGAAAAVGRATVSDCFEGTEAAARVSTLVSLMLLSPIAAPVIGGVILMFTDWRADFFLMGVLGVAMTAGAWFGIPETLPAKLGTLDSEKRIGVAEAGRWSGVGSLVGDPVFLGLLGVAGLSSAAIFVYIGGSSFVFQDRLGLDARAYSFVFTVDAAVMAAASLVFRTLVVRVAPALLQRIGLLVSAGAAVTMLAATVATGGHPAIAVIWALLALLLGGVGLSAPASAVRIQHVGRRYGGTASALNGGLGFISGAITAPLLGLIGVPSVASMATLLAAVLVTEALLLTRVDRLTRATRHRAT